MKLKNKRLMLLPLMILLNFPMSASAQLLQQNLRANEISPFDGVLIPYETYRKMSQESLDFDMTKSELEICKSEIPGALDIDFKGYVISFSIGVIGGLVLKEVLK